MSSQFHLMRERRFRPFFFTQFLGAFNDNVFKTALITLVTFRAGQLTNLDGKMLATLLPGLFILPFFLFSATSGQIADKFEKSAVARAVKIFEICIMLLAAWGFLVNLLWPLVTALFLMGVHSTLFGPVKYAYLPQQLKKDELIGGNGMIEMGTFVAILLGEVLGAWLATAPQGSVMTSMMIVGLAVLGYWASRGFRCRRRPIRNSKSTGIRSPRPGATSPSCAATVSSGYRFSASRGSGSTVRRCWRSFRITRRKCSAAMRAYSFCYSRFFPSVSAVAHCSAKGYPATRSKSVWYRLVQLA